MDVSGREKMSGEWGKVCACRRGHGEVCVCAQEEQSEHMAEDKALFLLRAWTCHDGTP